MAFSLILKFRGLCGFAPLSDSMWVLLPDEKAYFLGEEVPQPHTAVARFKLAYIDKDAPDSDVILKLSSCDLEILPGGKPIAKDNLEYIAFNPITGMNLVDENHPDYLRSLYWVAPVEEASQAMKYSGGGVVRPGFLGKIADLPQRESDLLAARVLLRSGKVSVKNLAARNDRGGGATQIVQWKFAPYGGTALDDRHYQLLASEIWVEMWIADDYVTLQYTPFRKKARQVALRPGAGGDLVIEIMNEESDAIVGTPQPPYPIVLHSPRVQDRVFESLYNFTVTPVPATARAIPVAYDYYYPKGTYSVMGATTMVFPPCSPARYNVAVASANIQTDSISTEHDERSATGTVVRDFLLRFGYLTAAEEEMAAAIGTRSLALRKALERFQRRSGLKVTGELNKATRRAILAPRCLVAAEDATCCLGGHTLTYRLGAPPRLFGGSAQDAFDQIRLAMDIWQAVDQVKGGSFVFREAVGQEVPDFEVGWADIPRPGGVDVIAFADLPGDCSVVDEGQPRPLHFSQAETWGIGGGSGSFDVLSVALHELGHIIGLKHQQAGTVMYASFQQTHDRLTDGDVGALRKLCDDCAARLLEEVEEDLD